MNVKRFVFVCATILTFAMAGPATADVTIHCLAVGQADATLIVSSSGQTLLFDGGNNGAGNGIIVPYLTSLGITTLDYMAASHYHADHCGGLDEVYDAVGVTEAVYDRGWSYTTITYGDYAAAVAPKRQIATDGMVIDLGDNVTVTVVALNGNGQMSSPYDSSSKENEYCLALLVECEDFAFFAAGDLTGGGGSYSDIETSVGPEVGDIEIYRVNHHGSYSSSNASFLADLTPEVSIISVPDSSPYGHPHQDVLNRLAALDSYIYQTAQGSSATYPADMRTIVNGHVIITSDGVGEYYVNGTMWETDEGSTATPVLATLQVYGNHPNPFNPSTVIRFELPDGGPVNLAIHDLAGRVVRAVDWNATAGAQGWRWNGRDESGRELSSGVYLYRIVTRDGTGSGRMTLAR
ncbi:T9SS type A sorting domain-containing protein [bacterium]|nr:T9SS type A sorting domain-containing protein [bacterium]